MLAVALFLSVSALAAVATMAYLGIEFSTKLIDGFALGGSHRDGGDEVAGEGAAQGRVGCRAIFRRGREVAPRQQAASKRSMPKAKKRSENAAEDVRRCPALERALLPVVLT